MANWKSFEIQVPGKDLLEPVREVLETLLVFLEVLKAILDTIKTFLVDFGNPIRALVEALIRLIEELFLALKRSGFFGYFDVPDPSVDPNFDLVSGGFQAFTERWKASLVDSKDFNRPQPRTGSSKGGFVILMVDASDPFTLIKRIKVLLAFFGKDFLSPRYEAPANLQVFPVGDSGDRITALAGAFASNIEAIELIWTLPSSIRTPDPGFQTLVGQLAGEFIPPAFLIERSTAVNPSQRIVLTDLGNADATGVVEYDRPTTWFDRKGQTTTIRTPLLDDQGDPVVKFQKYTILDQTDIEGILGQLGRFRYIDTDVELEQIYYYRVRAFSGDLTVTDNKITFPTAITGLKKTGANTYDPNYVLEWPADDGVVMGKPSGITSVRIPRSTGDFDVIENLRRLFQTAFSLQFQEPAKKDSTFGEDGRPTGDTSPTEVGVGSLTNVAGGAAIYSSIPVLAQLASGDSILKASAPDVTGGQPELPWTNFQIRRQSARLADAVASAMLEANAVSTFQQLMSGPFPEGAIDNVSMTNLSDETTVSGIVFDYTIINDDGTVPDSGYITFVNTFNDVGLRLNILAVIQFIKSFTLGGVPPDWISVVPLRDIIPWAGEILYDLLDKIQALLDAFNGVMDEIRAFIDLIERKIAALERFIQFLIDILNLIESLQIGAFLLSVPDVSGDVFQWFEEVDNAGGAKPPSGPGGYSAGVSFAYVAPDIVAFKAAFSLIFG